MMRHPNFKVVESTINDISVIKILDVDEGLISVTLFDRTTKNIIYEMNYWYDDYPMELATVYLEDEYGLSQNN